MKLRKGESLGVILFLAPALLLFVMFFIYPIFNVVGMSFFNWNGITDPVFSGFENYKDIFTDKVFIRSITNNVIWALAACCVQVPLALLMALILSRKPRFWQSFRTIYFLPQVISGIAIAMLWSAVFNSEFGMLNGLLKMLGLGKFATNWLGNPKTAFACVLIYGLFYIGYYMVIMMAGITNIDESYYEAAKVDGASPIQTAMHVTVPLIRYSVHTCITLAAIFGLRTFEQVYLLTNGGPANRTSLVVLYLYNQMRDNNYGGANASSVILIVVGAIVIVSIRKMFKFEED
ncbi:carbohydrate ABC transporter permease [Anaerobium acetethylicum]|uniref:Raffinose/stachyose/melibiose transport system permease protein n=1 Tax=Anaerobium acetethylicum TaxID=1619234 RepID=A0A1D3TV22_9FIRM|nr:sugar ABC transporter permease [Anaerobium acetethylicum]SCP97964.1 raffinose/stachyose/melibiose transport system permease protein [Anaerobium acetethylicum]